MKRCRALVFVFLFTVLFATPAFADYQRFWDQVEMSRRYPTPVSPIDYNSADGLGKRDYTHKLYAFFQYDDGVAGPLTVGWTDNACSFDVLDRINEDTGAAALPVNEVTDPFLRQAWFETLFWNVLTDESGTKQYYQLHFDWWKNPDGSDKYDNRVTWTFNDYPRELPVRSEYGEHPEGAGSTWDDPAKIQDGPPYDVAYVDKPHNGGLRYRSYWIEGTPSMDISRGPGAFTGKVGWWMLTNRDAQGLVSAMNQGKRHGYLIFRVGFPYDIGFEAVNEKGDGVELVSRGESSNTYRVSLVNLMPYLAKNVRLKAYKVMKGMENTPVLVAEKICPEFGGHITYFHEWTFSAPTSQEPYYIVVTANMDYHGGDILNLDNYTKHNLVTKYNASGDVKVHGDSGAQEANYSNNKVWIEIEGQTYLPDYKAEYVKVYKPDGGEVPDGGSVRPDDYCRLEGKFVQQEKKFTRGQYVRVALGVEDGGTKVLKENNVMWFPGPDQPQYLVFDGYKFGGNPRTVTVFASVNGDRRIEESDYTNNRAYTSVVVSSVFYGDLAATYLSTGAPQRGGADYDVAKEGTTYTATARFKSTFSMPGYAYVRLYWKTVSPTEGQPVPLQEQQAYFQPNGEVTLTANWSLPSGARGGIIYATVARKWDSGGWVGELFEDSGGKQYDEAEPGNNIIYRSVSIDVVPVQTDRAEQKYLREITRTEKTTVEQTVWYEDGVWVLQKSDKPSVSQEIVIVR